jgi:hypothetical protein
LAHQHRQAQLVDLFQMHPAMVFAAVLTVRQNTDDRNPLTAMFAIHGAMECIWGAKRAETGSPGK